MKTAETGDRDAPLEFYHFPPVPWRQFEAPARSNPTAAPGRLGTDKLKALENTVLALTLH
jgi:hypothetical protein